MFSSFARTALRTGARKFSGSGGGGGGGGGAVGLLLGTAACAGVGFQFFQAQERDEKVAALQQEVDGLEIALAGKTNSAFVFIKPHACKGTPGKVEALVEESFKNAGIRVTGSGSISAEEIDEKQYIDTHYGAIASKAVKLQPSELNVPDKGKAQFLETFGESWEDALAAGKVFNAKDGAAHLGIDGAGLDKKWSTLKKKGPETNLLKFGGGFYCGKVDGIYIMNGFYMSMRSAYTTPGEKIQWYTVSWPADSLSWADFRGSVLGATDPATAPTGSVRRAILDNYKQLGLDTKPNTGDNGVHASASPFEAMAERVNWLGQDVTKDSFGRAALKVVPADKLAAWSGDAQVAVEGETAEGKTMSVFDTLEDLDADDVLAKLARVR